MTTPPVRLATEADLPAINDIHRHYVETSTSTYALAPLTLDERTTWFCNRAAIHPVTVLEIDGAVVAWGALGTFRVLAGYRTTVENSVYVHPQYVRQGLGSRIIADQIERARQLDLRAIVAVVDSKQTASLALHKKHGFIEVGRLPQIARKFDTFHDAVFLQVLL